MSSSLFLRGAAGSALVLLAASALAAYAPPDQQVRVPERQARELALDRVAQGDVQRGRLEERGERPTWVFDVGRYNEPTHVTTIRVDAETGAVQSGTPHDPVK